MALKTCGVVTAPVRWKCQHSTNDARTLTDSSIARSYLQLFASYYGIFRCASHDLNCSLFSFSRDTGCSCDSKKKWTLGRWVLLAVQLSVRSSFCRPVGAEAEEIEEQRRLVCNRCLVVPSTAALFKESSSTRAQSMRLRYPNSSYSVELNYGRRCPCAHAPMQSSMV